MPVLEGVQVSYCQVSAPMSVIEWLDPSNSIKTWLIPEGSVTSIEIISVLPNSKGSALSIKFEYVGGVVSESPSITLIDSLTDPQLL